ncbi:TetR family transcriptional regulator [Streptacidiphilus pinicola]|uniref:TetR family transcriptional regulator n=1 Tax=Streptacidiphilus pinicola TaxID=2219663 RepID=A0A2X0IB27_9ACTN|nr:TetR/AcrR family transcriptional regulator [Streptacidiphilus pinicola]RAG80843.1 TetR family transcriptional regulator [Streptacidiphilus pinicola]
MSAEERRESVIRAAMVEFADRGYNGTSTAAIARRVGVSQPYLFRLFENKRALFEAAVRRCIEELKETFLRAAEGKEGEEARQAMAAVYFELIRDKSWLLMQLQMYVSTAAAEAAGDHEVGEAVRALWTDLWDSVAAATGASPEEITEFFAYGMLINNLVAMGFPVEHRLWQGFGEEYVGCPAVPVSE